MQDKIETNCVLVEEDLKINKVAEQNRAEEVEKPPKTHFKDFKWSSELLLTLI